MASTSIGSPPVSFHIAFERLKDLMSKDDSRAMASTTMKDVWTAAKDIEHQLELRRSLRGFRRIQPFLAGIEQYSKVVEVVCNGTPYLPYLWAPIKLLLQIAQNHISALERLIDAYAMIGESMPRFDKLSAAFIDDPEFLQVMGHFYEDVLEFHRRAYKFFRRRAWKMVFDSLWKTFDSRFQAILQSLRKHRDLIDQEASTINIVEAKTWRGQQLEQIREWRAERAKDLDNAERERLNAQIREVVVWFGAEQDQEYTLTRLLGVCNSADGHWALREPMILSWLEQSRDTQFVWLHGKPGAGKSVICAKVIEHVQDATDGVVIYYFCSHHQNSQSPANEILRSFATQLLAANTELAPYILETFANQALRPTKKNLSVILEKLITSLSSVRIVVDGVDESATSEQEEIIGDLLRIKGSAPGVCKILLSCRKLPTIFRLLRDKPTLRLDDHTESMNATISSFVRHELGILRQEFDSSILDELEGQIIAKANGMFLWVRLVLFTLKDLHFEEDIRQAAQTLPEDLESVYESILSRICGNSRAPNQRTATRILQWMLVARRPLKRYEIESGIILDERISHITPATRPRGDVLSSCYPILDVEDGPGGNVSFCHFTAFEYLRTLYSSPSLQYLPAQLTVSLACVLYLITSFDLIDRRVPTGETRSQIVQCFHDLQFYANDHWLDHLSALVNSPTDSMPNGSTNLSLSKSLERLTERHNEIQNPNAGIAQDDSELLPSATKDGWHRLGVTTSTQNLLKRVLAFKSKIGEDDQIADDSSELGGQDDPTLFSSIRGRYQSILEDLLEHSDLSTISGDFAARRRSGSYLCRHRSCPHAIQGFASSYLRQEHENSHAPRFRCNDAACEVFARGLTSRAAMNKHNKKYHCNDGLTAIPPSLRKSSTRLQQDRSRFLLEEPSATSRNPSFDAAEEGKFMNEVDAAPNPADTIQNLMPSIIKCICGFADDGTLYLIKCDLCNTAQHFQCYYMDAYGHFSKLEEHFCVDCKPRPIEFDAKDATTRQMERKKQRSEYFRAADEASKEVWNDGFITWSVRKKEILRALIRYHGTDWTAIAQDMRTKSLSMIQSYYYEQTLINKDDQLEEDAQRADYESLKRSEIESMLLDQQHRKGLVSHVDYQTQMTRLKQQKKLGLFDDYDLQLMALEQQKEKQRLVKARNKKQLLQARDEEQSRSK